MTFSEACLVLIFLKPMMTLLVFPTFSLLVHLRDSSSKPTTVVSSANLIRLELDDAVQA